MPNHSGLQTDFILNALDQSNAGFMIVGPKGEILFFNEGAEKILGIDIESQACKNFFSLPVEYMSEEGDLGILAKKVVMEKRPLEIVSDILNSRGSHVSLSVNAKPVLLNKKRGKKAGCALVFYDISWFKSHEAELEKKLDFTETYLAKYKEIDLINKRLMKEAVFRKKEIGDWNHKLKELNSSILEAFQNISHEILSPLANIVGFCELIKEDKTLDKSEIIEFIENILGSGKKIDSLANRILSITRLDYGIESGTIIPRPRLIDFNSIITNSIKEHSFAIKKKSLEIKKHLHKGKLELRADMEMLDQVISNLISNAIKYTPKGGKISIETLDEGNSIRLRVKDTGMGIPEEDIPKIFERFHRVNSSKAASVKGIGIGLNLVKMIIDLHEGSISVKSRLEEGTLFDIFLPKDPSYKEREINEN